MAIKGQIHEYSETCIPTYKIMQQKPNGSNCIELKKYAEQGFEQISMKCIEILFQKNNFFVGNKIVRIINNKTKVTWKPPIGEY